MFKHISVAYSYTTAVLGILGNVIHYMHAFPSQHVVCVHLGNTLGKERHVVFLTVSGCGVPILPAVQQHITTCNTLETFLLQVLPEKVN